MRKPTTFPRFLSTGKIPLEIIRHDLGHYERGRWVEGVGEPVEIMANVQPVKPHELLNLSESDRTKRTVKVFSTSPLLTAKEGIRGSDTFLYDEDEFEIKYVKKWEMGVLNHYWALAVAVANLENEDDNGI